MRHRFNRNRTIKEIPIAVTCSSDDAVGQSFCYEVKNELARSAIYSYSPKLQGFVISMVTVNADDSSTVKDENKNASAVSIDSLLVADNTRILMRQAVVVTGKDKTEYMAKRLLANLDRDLSGSN